MQLGMPPDTADRHGPELPGPPFYKVFNAVDDWQRRPDRNLSELPGIIGKIPQLQDIDIDGRSVLGIYRNYRATGRANSWPRTRTAWRTCCRRPCGSRSSTAWT